MIPESVRRGTAPRSADLSAETAAQIEQLVPGWGEQATDAVVVRPWTGPHRGPARRGAQAQPGDGDVRVDVIEAGGQSGASTVAISGPHPGGGWLSPKVAEYREVCAGVVRDAVNGQTIILAAPVFIGATRELLIQPLAARGFVVGRDIHVAFCPTPVGAGKPRSRPRVVGGATSECALAAIAATGSRGPVEVVVTPELAEASALAALPRSRVGAALKRGIDLAVAAVGLVLMLPIFVLVALAIRLDDGGPILFSQERVGQNGRLFRIRKFRTMVAGAESRLDEVVGLNGIRGPAFQIDRDPRLTRLGRFLRKSSIDELPQLWNVLSGDMSLVGPRPAPLVEVNAYEPWHQGRLTMRPGITGLAQVRARSYVEFDEKAGYDIEYIMRWSPLLDFVILLQTVPVVLRLTGR